MCVFWSSNCLIWFFLGGGFISKNQSESDSKDLSFLNIWWQWGEFTAGFTEVLMLHLLELLIKLQCEKLERGGVGCVWGVCGGLYSDILSCSLCSEALMKRAGQITHWEPLTPSSLPPPSPLPHPVLPSLSPRLSVWSNAGGCEEPVSEERAADAHSQRDTCTTGERTDRCPTDGY